MPWMAVEKEYGSEGPNGTTTLADLFEGRRQLIVYRDFYGPEVTTYANPERGDAYPPSGRAWAAPSSRTKSPTPPT
jgi:predicted dithiol-disulfide oxidoreductase (DUF899 family)